MATKSWDQYPASYITILETVASEGIYRKDFAENGLAASSARTFYRIFTALTTASSPEGLRLNDIARHTKISYTDNVLVVRVDPLVENYKAPTVESFTFTEDASELLFTADEIANLTVD